MAGKFKKVIFMMTSSLLDKALRLNSDSHLLIRQNECTLDPCFVYVKTDIQGNGMDSAVIYPSTYLQVAFVQFGDKEGG